MAFTPKKVAYRGAINAVTLGTGDKAVVIGGQNVLPFYTFDAPIENAPKIGIEISDCANEWNAPALKEFYAGCTTMADYAKKAETMPESDSMSRHLFCQTAVTRPLVLLRRIGPVVRFCTSWTVPCRVGT